MYLTTSVKNTFTVHVFEFLMGLRDAFTDISIFLSTDIYSIKWRCHQSCGGYFSSSENSGEPWSLARGNEKSTGKYF